ncbi:hypothetical protein EG68_07081 [Paragonimus skrjabini miyazakii]|uniref:Uncharacterized protein n=1 Tax=Paragonimus skrjabini miyazakii TaxID=59628 RepID=A0A8S9YPM1_9TREM|nr:hypothetical protein EG68_07081 [Paragonimus skrjabini miyazakii]
MCTGRELLLPLDLQTNYPGRLPLLITEYVISLWDSTVRSHEVARRHLNEARRRQEEYYDKKANGGPLLVEAKVYLLTDVPSHRVPTKLQREWKGLFIVEGVLSDKLRYIRSTYSCQKPMVTHFSRLKPAETSTEA